MRTEFQEVFVSYVVTISRHFMEPWEGVSSEPMPTMAMAMRDCLARGSFAACDEHLLREEFRKMARLIRHSPDGESWTCRFEHLRIDCWIDDAQNQGLISAIPVRPGEAAALYAKETGCSYERALVACNMD